MPLVIITLDPFASIVHIDFHKTLFKPPYSYPPSRFPHIQFLYPQMQCYVVDPYTL